MQISHAFLLSLGVVAASAAKRPPAKNAILLSDVQTLTLRGGGAKTSHRRVKPVPQLKCVSSKALCDLHSIDVMRCTNQGASYGDEDIEWSCSASLPAELKLGSTDVICEGYASSNDPYVLKGSCGVEYTLALTERGERKYPDVANSGRWFSDGRGGTDTSAWLFAIIFVAVFAWIAYSACVAGQENTRRRRTPGTRRGGGGGGSGGGGGGPGGPGGWDPRTDAPPPYPGTDDTQYRKSEPGSSSQQQQGWRPGFWTGLASGAAATYLTSGNRNNRNTGYNNNGWGSSSSSPWGGDSFAGPSSSSRGGGSGERHESTGFGSTRRR